MENNVTNNMENLVNEQIDCCRIARNNGYDVDAELNRLDRMVQIYKDCNDISEQKRRWEIDRNDRLAKERADREIEVARITTAFVSGLTTLCGNSILFDKGLRFETTGTVTSMFFKNFIGKKC